jgi:hypothetical protein
MLACYGSSKELGQVITARTAASLFHTQMNMTCGGVVSQMVAYWSRGGWTGLEGPPSINIRNWLGWGRARIAGKKSFVNFRRAIAFHFPFSEDNTSEIAK